MANKLWERMVAVMHLVMVTKMQCARSSISIWNPHTAMIRTVLKQVGKVFKGGFFAG